MSQWGFQLRQLTHRLWFLPAAFSLLAVLTVTLAFLLGRWIPESLPFQVPSNAVQSILEIMASSLLTVAVFALSTIVAALSSASSATTPRAVPLIVGDRRSQASISVFIGAFLYSIVGIIGLAAGLYSEAGRLVLFVVTLLVVLLVIASLIRWIGQISAIGRVGETIRSVEEATHDAFHNCGHEALFGCQRLVGEAKGTALFADNLGYVQHFDAGKLQRLAEEHDLRLAVTARPGTYVSPVRPLLRFEGTADDEVLDRIRGAFVLGNSRTFDSDPRYGVIVLGEVADKALSAGLNDPGTAIDVIGTLTRVLVKRERVEPAHEPFARVWIEPLNAGDLIEDAFRPIARDGAAIIEVVQRLLLALEIIAASCPDLRDAAKEQARDARDRAAKALTMQDEIAAVERAAQFAD